MAEKARDILPVLFPLLLSVVIEGLASLIFLFSTNWGLADIIYCLSFVVRVYGIAHIVHFLCWILDGDTYTPLIIVIEKGLAAQLVLKGKKLSSLYATYSSIIRQTLSKGN